MTGWTDWSDWSGDWSDWSSDWATDWASDWAGDWGDYSVANAQSNTTLYYSPMPVPRQMVYVNPVALAKAYELGVTREELIKLGVTNPQILMRFPSKKGKKKSGKSEKKPQNTGMPPTQAVIHGLAPAPDAGVFSQPEVRKAVNRVEPRASEAEINQAIRRMIASGKTPQQVAREIKRRYGVDVSFESVNVTVRKPENDVFSQPEVRKALNRTSDVDEREKQSVLESLVTRRTIWDDLRAGIPALTVVSAISGIGAGMRYYERRRQYEAKVKVLEDRRRRIEQMIEEGKRSGKITVEGGKLVVLDDRLYNRLKVEEEKYNRGVREAEKMKRDLESMERDITPPFSAKDYPVIGGRIQEAEESAFKWLREKTAPFGVAGQFTAGLGIGVVSLVEFPAFLSSLVTKPETIGASMAVHALENPAEFAGTMVGALVAGKAVGSAIGRGAGAVGRGVETVRAALTEPRPVRQTIIIGDEVVYQGNPLNRPIIAESTRITDIRPVNVRVEKSAVEYRGFRAEMAEVEEGTELNVEATPVRAAKVETVEPAWKITLKRPADVRVITEYQSIVDRLKGRRDVIVSETRGGETAATLYVGVRSWSGNESRVAGVSAETVRRVKSKVLEEFEMPESDTAVITRPTKPEAKVRTSRTPFDLDEVVKSRIERARRSGSEAKSGERTETLTVERNEAYLPRFDLLGRSHVSEKATVDVTTRPGTAPPLPVHSVTIGPSVLTLPRLGLELKPKVRPGEDEGTIYVPVETPKPGQTGKGDGDLELPILTTLTTPSVGPGPGPVPPTTTQIARGLSIFAPGVSFPQLYVPMLTLPQQGGQPSGKPGWGEKRGRNWWTGLMASFNVLSRYELSGLAEGRKGVHMLVPDIAKPYWEKFLLSAGFASIPVAQQMERRSRRKKRKKRRK